MEYIELENVSKAVKNHKIIDNISLSLEKGKIYGFSGANGSGKSVLFRIICGLVVPSSGIVSVAGKKLFKPERRFPDSIGIMIDGIGLFPYLTGIENLEYLSSIKKIISFDDIKKVMTRVGLDPDNKTSFSRYSLGMKQRLIIAQAIMEKPDILIFDEPTNALDDKGVQLFREIAKRENERGATILISSHNAEDLKSLCSITYHLDNGRIERGVS